MCETYYRSRKVSEPKLSPPEITLEKIMLAFGRSIKLANQIKALSKESGS